MNHFYLLAVFSLASAPAFAGPAPQPPKKPEAICEHLAASKAKYLQPAPSSCWIGNPLANPSSIRIPKLRRSYELLSSYYDSQKGLVAGCQQAVKRLNALQQEKAQVDAECQAKGAASAAQAQKKNPRQQAQLIETQAYLMNELESQRKRCATRMAGLADGNAEHKDHLAKLTEDVRRAFNSFSDRGVAELENISTFEQRSGECAGVARGYKALVKETTDSLLDLSHVVGSEHQGATNSATNYRRQAQDAADRATELRERAQRLRR